MFYPIQVVDGLVHLAGGPALAEACQAVPEVTDDVRCPVGGAVATPATGRLGEHFLSIVHTVPPMYGSTEWSKRLAACYASSLSTAWRCSGALALAVPLL